MRELPISKTQQLALGLAPTIANRSSSPAVKAKFTHGHAVLDKTLALTSIAALLPLYALNSALGVATTGRAIKKVTFTDALDREVAVSQFSAGLFKSSASMFDVLSGKLALVGMSLQHSLPSAERRHVCAVANPAPGLVSLQDIHHKIGLVVDSPVKLVEKQLALSPLRYLGVLAKSSFLNVFFKKPKAPLDDRDFIHVCDTPVNNIKMSEAVDWVVSDAPMPGRLVNDNGRKVKTAFFVNAHSVNLCTRTPWFRKELTNASALFADGSGMRLAAKVQGFELKDNINGTDMLPHLCQAAVKANKSIFLLGAKEGIAQKAAKNLKKQYPGLRIAGTRNGYFKPDDSPYIVKEINETNPDIVLVATGSPNQERWINQWGQSLSCASVLAVGGLFDYFADAIPRAPMWMRELGLEWVWRLMQEPKTKFNRYVVGTPEFLLKLFLVYRR